MSDLDLITEKLRALVGDHDMGRLMLLVHDGEPISKARARVVVGGAFTPKRTKEAQSALAWAMHGRSEVFTANVALAAVFFRPNHQRVDVDNLMKLVFDAGTEAGLWLDDCQVTAQIGLIELDRERPRTVIACCDYVSTLQRGGETFVCSKCGKTFIRPRSAISGRPAPPLFCSATCRYAAARVNVRCSCGTIFRRKTAGQRFCSNNCRLTWLHHRRARPLCRGGCGRTVTRREYLFCRTCSSQMRASGAR